MKIHREIAMFGPSTSSSMSSMDQNFPPEFRGHVQHHVINRGHVLHHVIKPNAPDLPCPPSIDPVKEAEEREILSEYYTIPR